MMAELSSSTPSASSSSDEGLSTHHHATQEGCQSPSKKRRLPAPIRPGVPPTESCPRERISEGPAEGWEVEIYVSKDCTDSRGWAPRGNFISPDDEVHTAPRKFRRNERIPKQVRDAVDQLYERLRQETLDKFGATGKRSRSGLGTSYRGVSKQAHRIASSQDPFLEICRRGLKTTWGCQNDSLGRKATQRKLAEHSGTNAGAKEADCQIEVSESSVQALTRGTNPLPHSSGDEDRDVRASTLLARIFSGEELLADSSFKLALGAAPEGDMIWVAACAGMLGKQELKQASVNFLRSGAPLVQLYQRLCAAAKCSNIGVQVVISTMIELISNNALLPEDPAAFSAGNASLSELAAHGFHASVARRILTSQKGVAASPLALSTALGIVLAYLTTEGKSDEDKFESLQTITDELENHLIASKQGPFSFSSWSHGASLLLGALWVLETNKMTCDRIARVCGAAPVTFGLQLEFLKELAEFTVLASEEQKQAMQGPASEQVANTHGKKHFARKRQPETSNMLAQKLLAERRSTGLGPGGFVEVAAQVLRAEGLAVSLPGGRPLLGESGCLALKVATAQERGEQHEAATILLEAIADRRPWTKLAEEGNVESVIAAFGKLQAGEFQDAWIAVIAWTALGKMEAELPFISAELLGQNSLTVRDHLDLRELLACVLLVQRALRRAVRFDTALSKDSAAVAAVQREAELLRCSFKKFLNCEFVTKSKSTCARFCHGLGPLMCSTGLPKAATQLLAADSDVGEGCLVCAFSRLLKAASSVELRDFLSDILQRADGKQWQFCLMMLIGISPAAAVTAKPPTSSQQEWFIFYLWMTAAAAHNQIPPCEGARPTLRPDALQNELGDLQSDLLGGFLECWETILEACVERPSPNILSILNAASTELSHGLIGRLLRQLHDRVRGAKTCKKRILSLWRQELQVLRRVQDILVSEGHSDHQSTLQLRIEGAFHMASDAAKVLSCSGELQGLAGEVFAEALALCLREPTESESMQALVRRHFCRGIRSTSPWPDLWLPQSELPATAAFSESAFQTTGKLARLNGSSYADVYRTDKRLVQWAMDKCSQGGSELHKFANWVRSEVLEPEPWWLKFWHRPKQLQVDVDQLIGDARFAAHFFCCALRTTGGRARWLEAEALDSALRLGFLLMAQGVMSGGAWDKAEEVLSLSESIFQQQNAQRTGEETWKTVMTSLWKVCLKLPEQTQALLTRCQKDAGSALLLARSEREHRNIKALLKVMDKRSSA